MEVDTLQKADHNDLTTCMNLAFSDYYVPFQVTGQQLADRMKNDNTDLSLSAGAFENGRLVGFILHATGLRKGVKTVYNGGTGVIPAARGQKLTARMYDFILPALRQHGFKTGVLEVMGQNQPAINAYRQKGFEKVRELDTYKGYVQNARVKNKHMICELGDPPWELFRSFADWHPSWQNSTDAMRRTTGKHVVYASLVNEVPVGFVIFNPHTKRVTQFAVSKAHRRQGHAGQLFQHVQRHTSDEIVLVNVDNGHTGTAHFLRSMGLTRFLLQFEMELKIK